jgi:hypothetical protein
MRPLEPAGSEGSTGAAPGLGAAAELADFFVGGKGEFYRKEGEFNTYVRITGAKSKESYH